MGFWRSLCCCGVASVRDYNRSDPNDPTTWTAADWRNFSESRPELRGAPPLPPEMVAANPDRTPAATPEGVRRSIQPVRQSIKPPRHVHWLGIPARGSLASYRSGPPSLGFRSFLTETAPSTRTCGEERRTDRHRHIPLPADEACLRAKRSPPFQWPREPRSQRGLKPTTWHPPAPAPGPASAPAPAPAPSPEPTPRPKSRRRIVNDYFADAPTGPGLPKVPRAASAASFRSAPAETGTRHRPEWSAQSSASGGWMERAPRRLPAANLPERRADKMPPFNWPDKKGKARQRLWF